MNELNTLFHKKQRKLPFWMMKSETFSNKNHQMQREEKINK